MLKQTIPLSDIHVSSFSTPILANYASDPSVQLEDPSLYETIQQAIEAETHKQNIAPLLVLALNQQSLTMKQKASLTIQTFVKDKSLVDGITGNQEFQEYWMLPLPYMDNTINSKHWIDALLEEAKKPTYGKDQDHKARQLAIHELKERRNPEKFTQHKTQRVIHLNQELRWLRDAMESVNSADDWVALLDRQGQRYCSAQKRVNPYFRYVSDFVFIAAAQRRPCEKLNDIVNHVYGGLAQPLNSNAVALLEQMERIDAGLYLSHASSVKMLEEVAPNIKIPASVQKRTTELWHDTHTWQYKNHWLSTPESIAYLIQNHPDKFDHLIAISPDDVVGSRVSSSQDLSFILKSLTQHDKPIEQWIYKNNEHWIALLKNEYSSEHIQKSIIEMLAETEFMLDSQQGPFQLSPQTIQHTLRNKENQTKIADVFYAQMLINRKEYLVGWYHLLIKAEPWTTALKPFKSDVYSTLYNKPMAIEKQRDLIATALACFTHLNFGSVQQISNTLSSLDAIGFQQPPSQWRTTTSYPEIPLAPEA
jgi:hypothetical protein